MTHVTLFRKYGKHSTGPSIYGTWDRAYSKLLSRKFVLPVCSTLQTEIGDWFVVTEPSRMESERTEECHVGLSREFVGTAVLTDSRKKIRPMSLKWRHNERDGVSNHLRLFRRKSKKTPKLRVNGFCEGKSSVTGEFPAQRASNAGNVSIWWRHHGKVMGHYVGVIALLLHGLFHLFNVKGRWKVLIILVGGFQRKRDPLLSH